MKFNLPRKTVLFVEASRWPWQSTKEIGTGTIWTPQRDRYGWFCKESMARFGGGWAFALGFRTTKSCIMFDLLFGIVKIRYETQKMRDDHAAVMKRVEERFPRPQKSTELLNSGKGWAE